MRQLVFTGVAVGLIVLALAACNGSSNSTPTVAATCNPGVIYQMVYPIPGATSVPDAPQQIAFAVSSPMPSTYDLVLNNANTLNGNQVMTAANVQTITASQVPQPSASPSIANPSYQSVSLLSSFQPATTIFVWLNDTASNCTPLGPVGSFTTQ